MGDVLTEGKGAKLSPFWSVFASLSFCNFVSRLSIIVIRHNSNETNAKAALKLLSGFPHS